MNPTLAETLLYTACMIFARPARTEDYDAVVGFWNEVYPDNRLSAAELRRLDAAHEPPYRFARVVAELGGEVSGTASFEQHAGMYSPQHFYLSVVVAPEAEGRGLGGRLYDRLLDDLEPFNPTVLRVQVRETHAPARRFAARRGFREAKRDFMATLEPARFDDAPLAGALEGAARQGLVIQSLTELGADPEARRKFYELFSEVRLDVPRSAPATPIPYETFVKQVYDAPDFFAAGTFVALDGEHYVGLTQFWRGEATDELFTGLTGVRRAYRGRGVALALKVHALRFARDYGAPLVRTDNDSRNVAMIALNDKLGFVRQPAYLSLVKTLDGSAHRQSFWA